MDSKYTRFIKIVNKNISYIVKWAIIVALALVIAYYLFICSIVFCAFVEPFLSAIGNSGLDGFLSSICDGCIKIMYDMSTIFFISYGAINVLLFIILEPLAILFFAISALLRIKTDNKTAKKLSIVSFIMGICIVLFIALPIIYTLQCYLW